MHYPIDSLIKIYYLILVVIGVPVNLLAIVILSQGKCGLCTCTSRYLVSMASADLLVIITEVMLWRVLYYYVPGSFLYITPVCSVINVLRCAATDCSVWFTVTFSFDRFVAICCQKLKTKYCTEKVTLLVLSISCILFCLKSVPLYFTLEAGEVINNIPWLCYIKPNFHTDPGWIGFDWFDKIMNPLLPFTVILLLNVLTVRHILVASRVRKRLTGGRKAQNHIDPEMKSRKKSMILLFSVSGSFILLWLVYVVHFLYYNTTGANTRDYNNSEFTFQRVGFMLRNLSCCTNTFIYVATQSRFREQLRKLVKYPMTSMM
ncbi:probable G-protein coupled receptor 139 [Stegostoma tigrinum]|uniref:probable G-protein coupled receptor 139 n=1 Tax=Stegostoma tigrinum TaxID=3053191 RepID=UPI00202B0149|nr:probable G-protein coupled receptor 139 [Stegostoma tigrinum]